MPSAAGATAGRNRRNSSGRRLPVEPAWRGRPEQLGRLSDPGYLRSAQRRAATIDGRLIGLQRLRSNEKRHVPQQRTWRFFFGEPITGGKTPPARLPFSVEDDLVALHLGMHHGTRDELAGEDLLGQRVFD